MIHFFHMTMNTLHWARQWSRDERADYMTAAARVAVPGQPVRADLRGWLARIQDDRQRAVPSCSRAAAGPQGGPRSAAPPGGARTEVRGDRDGFLALVVRRGGSPTSRHKISGRDGASP